MIGLLGVALQQVVGRPVGVGRTVIAQACQDGFGVAFDAWVGEFKTKQYTESHGHGDQPFGFESVIVDQRDYPCAGKVGEGLLGKVVLDVFQSVDRVADQGECGGKGKSFHACFFRFGVFVFQRVFGLLSSGENRTFTRAGRITPEGCGHTKGGVVSRVFAPLSSLLDFRARSGDPAAPAFSGAV